VDPLGTIGIPLSALVPIAVHAHYRAVFTVPLSLLAVVFLAIFAASIWTRGVSGRPLAAVAVTVLGVIYTGAMISFGYGIRHHGYAVGAAAGTALLGLPMVLTWASDTGAYFVGRAMGRRKLIPSVSPGKTVEGAVGGLLATVLVTWLYVAFVLGPVAQLGMGPANVVLFGIAISVAAQVGDLAESLLKREAGVKDSSRLIPGHGGVLDRLDSMFFVMPVAYLLLGAMLVPAPG
jgi:phosphatidate cytidylyltransferase